jgi:hypothetical protein
MLGVAERNERRTHTALRGKFLRRPAKDEKRFATWLFANIDVAPAHCFADSGPECFRNSFFRCEARSQMARWKFHRYGIRDLAVCENTMKKSITKPINGMLNASALDKIDTDADDTHLEFELCVARAAPG